MMRKVLISELSDIEADYFLDRSSELETDVLVVAFNGTYRPGSLGNGDGTFIKAETIRALAAYEPCGIVIDFRNLDYVWGNTLLGVFQAIDQYRNEPGEPNFPVVVVTSSKCREAFLSLVGGDRPTADGRRWQFEDFDEALAAAHVAALAWLDA